MAREILLGGAAGGVALVDDDAYEMLNAYRWHRHSKGYAARVGFRERGGRKTSVYMHREVTKAPAGVQVDHIDGNKLNNTRANLRFCEDSQNKANSPKRRTYAGRSCRSQYKGVSRGKNDRKWYAYITVERKAISLGSFADEKDAAHAYDRAAYEHYGDFAQVNFPLKLEDQA